MSRWKFAVITVSVVVSASVWGDGGDQTLTGGCTTIASATGVARSWDAPGVFRIEREVVLPQRLRWAMDVRWAGGSTLLIAAGQEGVVETDLEAVVTGVPIPGGSGRSGLWLATRVGVSDELLAGLPAGRYGVTLFDHEASGTVRAGEETTIRIR